MTHNLGGTDHDAQFNLTWTDASQLLGRKSSNGTLTSWTVEERSDTYVANGLNQYASVTGVNYSYDANDNLMSNGSRTFSYDLENRLTAVTGSPAMTLAYDPLGRLRQTVASELTTQYLYDGDRLIAEYDGSDSTVLRRYVHGPGIDEPIVWYEGGGLTERHWLHKDERGSVIAHSVGSGTTTPYSYGPYGEPNDWTGSRFRYTGQIMLPEVQLYHYKARVYDPRHGRFLQTDPIGYEDQMNLYAYAHNDPLNRFDPTGEAAPLVGCAVSPACRSALGFISGAAIGGAVNAGAQVIKTGRVDGSEVQRAALAAGGTGALVAAYPGTAGKGQLAALGFSVGTARSVSDDLGEGNDIEPGKALANGIVSAVAVPFGADVGGRLGDLVGAALGETTSAFVNRVIPEIGQSINAAIDDIKSIGSEASQALDQFMRQSICPPEMEAGCN